MSRSCSPSCQGENPSFRRDTNGGWKVSGEACYTNLCPCTREGSAGATSHTKDGAWENTGSGVTDSKQALSYNSGRDHERC